MFSVPTNDTSRDALSTEEMAELQYRLKNSLKLQVCSVLILDVSTSGGGNGGVGGGYLAQSR